MWPHDHSTNTSLGYLLLLKVIVMLYAVIYNVFIKEPSEIMNMLSNSAIINSGHFISIRCKSSLGYIYSLSTVNNIKCF